MKIKLQAEIGFCGDGVVVLRLEGTSINIPATDEEIDAFTPLWDREVSITIDVEPVEVPS